MEKSPNRSVAGSKRIGAKKQKFKQMLQTGRIEQRVSWGKIAEISGMLQIGRIVRRVDWSKTTENQANAPSRKNYTKSDLE